MHLVCVSNGPLLPAEAEVVDTTGWYEKVKEGRREVGAPDLDQVRLLQKKRSPGLSTLPYDIVVKPGTKL